MSEMGRIGRFVKAARSLLMVQLVFGLLAVALSVWAFIAVRDLATQRDQLQRRVSELENSRNQGMPTQPVVAPVDPTMAPVPIMIPVPIGDPASNSQVPVEPVPGTPPATGDQPTDQEPTTQTPTQPNPQPDCTGANAAQPRCRPGRWNRPPVTRVTPVAPEPQRTGNQQQPQIR